MRERLADWLETHWVTPAYAGWLLGAVAVCFFAAATNTMAGWLYVLSGIIVALLVLAAILPARSLRGIAIRRQAIAPVSAGDLLTITLEVENQSSKPKSLLLVQDILPYVLATPVKTPLEFLPPHSTHDWTYYQAAEKRGIYRWQEVQLRTAAPLGLFWCSRSWEAPATAIVYPTVLPLTSCPLVDHIGRDDSAQFFSDRLSQSATEDLTRSLRPYRVGDPTRLIHWRTSARFGQLQVRELEVFTGSQEFVICLDSAGWELDNFEQAVIAAASLYFYACRCQLNVKLWTASSGLLHGNSVILEALAAIHAQEDSRHESPSLPLIWLTQNPTSLNSLTAGSRWLLWQSLSMDSGKPPNRNHPGITIDTEEPLQSQLQRPLT
ncbi:MAG: DUF58 domain-containing protein [Kastovskya adunca ATA6-11-RM4]|jgi:uncharacterized protein (DUF58 family)|nr:DUF58 domain-containing protein [Kastovskya adunca ATA6-11-RM4]